MDSYHLLSIIVRRWFVVIPVALLAFVAGGRVVRDVDPVFEAKGMAVLTLLETAEDPTQPQRNPMLDFIGSLRTAAITASAVTKSGEAKAQLAKQGLSTDYDITLADEGPIVEIAANAPTEAGAVRAAQAVLQQLGVELDRLQDDLGAPENLRARVTILNTPTTATAVTTDKLRALIAVVAIGLAGTLALAVLVDSWIEGRRARRLLRAENPKPPRRRRRRKQRDESTAAEPGDEVLDVEAIEASAESDAVFAFRD